NGRHVAIIGNDTTVDLLDGFRVAQRPLMAAEPSNEEPAKPAQWTTVRKNDMIGPNIAVCELGGETAVVAVYRDSHSERPKIDVVSLDGRVIRSLTPFERGSEVPRVVSAAKHDGAPILIVAYRDNSIRLVNLVTGTGIYKQEPLIGHANSVHDATIFDVRILTGEAQRSN
ncbi:MAG: hypothetical protein AB7V44_22370, partial [Pseudonocardia sp.]